MTTGRSKQTPKKSSLKKTIRRVRARIESADQSAAASAKPLAAPTLPIIEEVDPQAATEAGAAAASLLVEAVQVISHTSHTSKYSIDINFFFLPDCANRPSAVSAAIGYIPGGNRNASNSSHQGRESLNSFLILNQKLTDF